MEKINEMDGLMKTNEIRDTPKRFLHASALISTKDPKFITYCFLPLSVEGDKRKNEAK